MAVLPAVVLWMALASSQPANARSEIVTSCSRAAAHTSALEKLLQHSSEELLSAVLSQLDSAQLICNAGVVSWTWANAAEEALRGRCEQHGWQPPRSKRLLAAAASALFASLKWRQLHLQRACRGCFNEAGDFAVRHSPHAAPVFSLCRACCKHNTVVQRLQQQHLTLDIVGFSGKPLYTKHGDRFCKL